MSHYIPMVGLRCGKLTVLGAFGTCKHGQHQSFLCHCDCGKDKVIIGNLLRSGMTQSCGCLQKERSAQTQWKHGQSGRRNGQQASPEYRAWTGMWRRIECKSGRDYRNYVLRGIAICERWRSFATFWSDMGLRPSPRHSLGRINNDGNYEPGNCRWETREQQAHNTRPLYRNNTSGVRGVYWRKDCRKWVAFIGENGQRRHLGVFDTIDAATLAYRIARAQRDLHV